MYVKISNLKDKILIIEHCIITVKIHLQGIAICMCVFYL